ncbi:MAG: hypothetical protein WBF58_09995 [Xanthobacteraceae bacterium]
MRFGCSATRRVLAGVLVAVACAVLCACSSSSSSSSGAFPNLFDPTASPTDTTLTPDQVKQAMDKLVSDRNQLCSAAIASQPAGGPPPDCVSTAVTGSTPAAGVGGRP